MAIFEAMTQDPESPRRKRLNAKEESIALLANRGGTGVILEYDGPGIGCEIDAVGTVYLDDYGLDDAPDGLSIWEGYLESRRTRSIECGDDWETELVGSFRDLTENEWELLRTTGTPWEFEPEGP